MTTQNKIPDGYMMDMQNRLIPLSTIKKVDIDRDFLVKDIVEKAKLEAEALSKFKSETMNEIESFITKTAKTYRVRMGGKKGNVVLTSFDGRYKVVRAISEFIVFDERLQVAKTLIDECIREWADGARDEIIVLINDAFSVNKQGKIDRNRILGLRRLKIKHPKWIKAMDAIAESMTVTNTKAYIRIYERSESGAYLPLNLDVANA